MKKNIYSFLFFSLVILINNIASAQNVGINSDGSTPDSKAMLDVKATGSGFLMPRMIWSSRPSSLTGTQDGLMIYSSDGDGTNGAGFYYYKNPNWLPLMDNKKAWSLFGNSGTTAGTNFIGTTDNQNLIFKSNNTERMRITPSGEVIVGGTAPVLPYDLLISTSLSVNYSWPINGYAYHNGGGIYGQVMSGNNTGFAGVQGEYSGTNLSGAGVRGISYNSSTGVEGVDNTGLGWAVLAYGAIGATDGFWNASDRKLKKNISTIKNALNKIVLLNGVEYDFDTEKYKNYSLSNRHHLGFIAQELESVIPEAVTTKTISSTNLGKQNYKGNTETMGIKVINVDAIIPLIVEAIKEQQKLIEQQQTQIEELKSTIEQLKKK
jgi:hypothetical protein